MRTTLFALHAALALAATAPAGSDVGRAEAAKPAAEARPRSAPRSPDVSENKRTVERYMDGFRTGDHGLVLSCLTDDVEWEIPGAFRLSGKTAFDKEIENEAFTGRPAITVTRLVEERDVVVAEGSVSSRKKDGGPFRLKFCDVFEMRGGKIKRLTSYLMEVK